MQPMLVLAHGGGELPPPLTPGRLLLDWSLDPVVLLPLVVIGAAYAVGVRRLAARGDRWPPGRTFAFSLGLGTLAVALASGLEAYDDVLFSAHMAQHMLLQMVAPVFLALGAPVTLALRTLPAGQRRALLGVLHSRVARVVTFPLVGFALYTLSAFALYFTPLYEASLRSSFVHALVHLHFVAVGCLFLWPILGVDPIPGRVVYPLRMLLVFLTLPFHAALGVTVMSLNRVIAADWYDALHRTWGASPLADQHTAGALLWAAGDAVGLLLFAVLGVQWAREDERRARQEDRRLDLLEARSGG